jgi:hypothetical protein
MKWFQRVSLRRQKSRFLARTTTDGDPVQVWVRLLPRKTEHLVLAGPLRWQIGEASNAHAVGKPAVDGSFDQIGREESKRDGHIDLSRAAVFPLSDAVGTRHR